VNVAFDRILKAWMTVGGGGEDERVEWPEIDWSLVDYPRLPRGETASQNLLRSFQ
jgi:hypothetical protein